MIHFTHHNRKSALTVFLSTYTFLQKLVVIPECLYHGKQSEPDSRVPNALGTAMTEWGLLQKTLFL